MGGLNLRDGYEFDPEAYAGEGGGILGMLNRYMQQQNQQQQGVDFGSTPNGAPEFGPEISFSPQGGLLGSLMSLQAEQSAYQPAAVIGGQAPPAWPNPNFRQLARLPNATLAQGMIGRSSLPGDQPNSAISQSGADPAAQPQRSLADRLQAYWDHPDPHGLIAMLKAASNGAAQAVQGSIDATSTPSTEEEAFRHNLGRELGPIGALKGASLQVLPAPGAATGVAGLIAKALIGRAASSVVAGISPLNPKPVASGEQPKGGPLGIVSGRPMPQWSVPPPIWGPRR